VVLGHDARQLDVGEKAARACSTASTNARAACSRKDSKFGREEAPGISAMLRGLVRAHPDDSDRLERGAAVFDDLYSSLA
jgi:hypothetical protein